MTYIDAASMRSPAHWSLVFPVKSSLEIPERMIAWPQLYLELRLPQVSERITEQRAARSQATHSLHKIPYVSPTIGRSAINQHPAGRYPCSELGPSPYLCA